MKNSTNINERGSSILEFALVASFLVPLFAGAFTVGMTLAKGIQVSNVARDAAVLMVRATVDPYSGLDLAQAQNQKIIVRAAAGLGMALNSTQAPDPNGKAVVILSKVVLVGAAECATGIVPAPNGAPPWTTANCPNYGSYVFSYRVVIGNTTRWTSVLGTPPTAIVTSNGTITASNIARNTSNRVLNMGAGGIVTLTPSTFALVSEMSADVSSLNLFSIMNTPILYARNVT